MLTKFVKHIEENIYSKELIYRSILVVNSNIECYRLNRLLNHKDYSSQIVEEIDNDIDYNCIDCRIMILCQNKFKDFVQHLDNNQGLKNSSYNFIGFNYTLEPNCVQNMIEFYLEKTNNNIMNTIILDNKYCNHIHLLENN